MKMARFLGVVCLGLWALSGGVGAAEVRPLEFLRALQERGYYDFAVEYLEMLQQAGDLPEELAEVYDLEMSKCLRGAANFAYDAKQAAEWMDRAQKHLDRFLAEKPNHPEAVSALVSVGSFSMDHALRLVRDAKSLDKKDEKQAGQLLAQGRARLAEARKRFESALATLARRRSELPLPASPGKGRPAKENRQTALLRAQLEASIIEAQFQIGLVDYYTAQTYKDPKDAARLAALKRAAKVFNDIWQLRRVSESGDIDVVGLQAHMWEGKVAEELGDQQTALDIYDEVLASEPDPAKPAPLKLDPLFAQVNLSRLLLIKERSAERFLSEAEEYLTAFARKSRFDGYQGIALEYAKTLAEMAQKAEGAEKTKLAKQALAVLNDMARVPSAYQAEAIQLRARLAGGAGALGDPSAARTFVEAVGVGDAALEASKWEMAAAAYRRALEIGDTSKDAASRLSKVKESLAWALYMSAAELYKANKFAEFRDAARKIAAEFPDTAVAADAAAMAVDAQLRLYASLPADQPRQRAEALDLLTKLATEVETRWPGKPQADDARMALAQAALVRGEVDQALAAFEAVSERSERYPVALSLAAQTYWRRYLGEKQKGPQADKARMDADHSKALQQIRTSVERFRRVAEPGKPLPRPHLEAELLLAEIQLDAGEAKEAASVLEPLVGQIKAEKPATLDLTMLRVFFAGAQAYLALGDVDRATEIGMILAELGADQPAINSLLIRFVRVLDGERRKAEAAVTEATAANDEKAHRQAVDRLRHTEQTIGKLLARLARRKEMAVTDLLYVGEQCAAVGLTQEASQLFQSVADLAQKGDATAQKLLPRARSRMIAQLRKEGKFEAAMDQVEQLVKENPRSLDAYMERARILQAWAERDPAQFDKAVAQWHFIRNLLEPSRRRFPREYYEVIYNAADCLRIQAEKAAQENQSSTAQARAADGAKLLFSALTLNPKLDGDPNTVARYKALLEKLKRLSAAGK